MATEIRIGSRGQTVGPLKPGGRICIHGETLDACSQGNWIDADAHVVVIGSRASTLVVRPFCEDDPPTETLGEKLTIGGVLDTTPLHAPLALVERFNAVRAGAVVGCVLIPVVWLCGTPLTVSALLVPVAGAATGFLFRWLVRAALESVGPREDHRPRAYEIAGILIGGAAVGAIIGVSIGFGFLGLSCGLVLGALLGGVVSWIGLLLANV
jgi:hypothetical protein